MQAWTIVSVIVSGFAACFLTLQFKNRLPLRSFLANVVYISAIWVPLGALYFFMEALAWFVGQIPMAGPIFLVLIPIARLLIIIMVVTKFLELQFGELITAGFIYLLLRLVLFPALGVMVFRALGIV